MNLEEKLKILTDAAKYDVACTSSGVSRKNGKGLGDTYSYGICHSFTPDGRCVTLLKILFSNECVFDCLYCINRRSNDLPRATFTPDEVCRLTVEFYRRNYIEGLFLSSGIIKNPDYTMEQIYQTIYKLRNEHSFYGYIHVKCIPGASPEIIEKTGFLADRMSVNIELPSAGSLKTLAPSKSHTNILSSMWQITSGIKNKIADTKSSYSIVGKNGRRRNSRFVPAGQSTQMIVGASPESDYQIIKASELLYRKFMLKRVFYSSFVDVNHNLSVPAVSSEQDYRPMLREHRLYQADWLMRFYNFGADELLDENHQSFNAAFDPKCTWALNHMEYFPVDTMIADYYLLLRVPGIGPNSAKRIVRSRQYGMLNFQALKKMGVVLKRAAYFITISGRSMISLKMNRNYIARALAGEYMKERYRIEEDTTYRQLSFSDLERSD